MRPGWAAFRQGLGLAWRYWPGLLFLVGVNLLAALLLAGLPALGLAEGLGRRPAIYQAADGLDAWLVMETLQAPQIEAALGQAGVETAPAAGLLPTLRAGLVAMLLLPLLAWLAGAFVTGGLLLVYAEAPQPFPWRRFFAGCWRWFGPFLLLGLIQGLLLGLGFFLALVTLGAVTILASPGLLAPVGAGLLVLLLLWLGLVEYARILAVVGDTRNVFRALGRSGRFLVHHPLALAGLYLPALLLLALLHGLYRWGVSPYLPLAWWLPVLLLQQAFILARLGARLVRLAGGIRLAQLNQ